MIEITKPKSQESERTSVVVDITTYRIENSKMEGEIGPKEIGYSAEILRFIDALVLDMVHKEWEGREFSE